MKLIREFLKNGTYRIKSYAICEIWQARIPKSNHRILNRRKLNEFYVEKMMQQISPKFSVLPQPLNKTLIGVVTEKDAPQVSEIWRGKFKAMYNHEILDSTMDDDESFKIIEKQTEKGKNPLF